MTQSDLPLIEMVGASAKMNQLRHEIKLYAESNAKVLVIGETGSGKEVVARMIHHYSPRRRRSFAALNCAAVAKETLLPTLFGHTQGAFTDAYSDRKGLFTVCDGGTVFLDEIGEAPLSLQAALLRFLETGEFYRVGHREEEPLYANIRLVTATNRDLRSMIEAGTFREDLFYRISTVVIEVPPLRERLEDMSDLVTHFLEYYKDMYPYSPVHVFSENAIQALKAYHWPGNIRELMNLVERAVVTGDQEVVRRRYLPKVILDVPRIYPAFSVESDEDAINRLFEELVETGDFRKVIRDPFINREITKVQVQGVVALGISAFSDDYRKFASSVGMQYIAFRSWVIQHECYVPGKKP